MKILTTTLALSLGLSALPAAAQQTRADLPVSVTFRNAADDAVRSDVVAPYVDDQQKVRAVMVGFEEGNLVLDTNDSPKTPLRRLHLTFAGQASMTDGLADVFMPMRSVDLYGLQDDLRTLAPGSSVGKRLNINWTSGKLNYHLRWNGENGAGFVTVACTAAATTNAVFGDTCGAWTFTALDTDHVGLYSSPSKGSYKETYMATISMPHEGYIAVK